jgi:hypothetical protein
MITIGMSYYRSVPQEDFYYKGSVMESDKTLYYEYDYDLELGEERRIFKGYKIDPIVHAQQLQRIWKDFRNEIRRKGKSKKYRDDVRFQKLMGSSFYRVNELTQKDYMHVHILFSDYLDWDIFYPILEKIARRVTGEQDRSLISMNIKEIRDRMKAVNEISDYLIKQLKVNYGELDYQEKEWAIGHSAKAMVNTHFTFAESVGVGGEVVLVKRSRGRRPFHRVWTESQNFQPQSMKSERRRRRDENKSPYLVEFLGGRKRSLLNLSLYKILGAKNYDKIAWLVDRFSELGWILDVDDEDLARKLRIVLGFDLDLVGLVE